MGVAVKRLRIGRSRQQVAPSSPLELALAPALVDGSWRVPDRFNLTRDFVEVLGRDPKRPALTILGLDGIIEPRTFRQLAEGAARWAHILRSRGIEPGDRVVVLSRLNEDWIDIALGCIKVGAIFAPAAPTISPHALESRVALTEAALVVAGEESEDAIARMSFAPEVHHVRSGRMRRASDVPDDEPTADTSARDVALVAWTSGTEGDPKPVAHTHGSLFAARATAERWLGVERGDLVWCATGPGSALCLSTIAGAWAHGAEVVLHEGDFHPDERLDLIRRVGPAVLCQSPAEYRALTTLRQLPRYRPPQLRRLLSTGDYLDPEVVDAFREHWGLEIESAYGKAETGIVATTRPDEERDREPGEIGEALPGHHLAVVDEHGAELPPGVEGVLGVRGRPPTLFAGYWDSPEETKRAFRGDWYLTGDVAVAVRPGVFRFLARSGELITARGRTFGPYEVERALAEHPAVSSSAVVGVRDLERGGQFVRAFVVLESGVEGSEQLEAELRQFVGQSLPDQQVPREIEFVDGLPRSASAAVRRIELRDRPVSGRPLWEAPPTSELDLEPPTTAELLTEPEPFFIVGPEAPEPEASGADVEAEIVELVEPFEQAELRQEPVAPAEPALGLAEDTPAPIAEAEPVPVADPAAPPLEQAAPPLEQIEPPLEQAAPPLEQIEPQGPPVVAPTPDLSTAHVAEQPSATEPFPEAAATPIDSPATPSEPASPAESAPEPPQAEPAPEAPADAPSAPVDETPLVGPPPEPEAAPRHLPEFAVPTEPAAMEVAHDELPRPEPAATGGPETPGVAPLAEPIEQVVEPEQRPEPEPAPPAEAETSPASEEIAPASAPTRDPEPLPDYIAASADEYASVPPPLEALSPPEPESADPGPLPEYVVDPSRRLEAVSPPSAARLTPPPAPQTEAPVPSTLEDHPLAGLARPQVAIPIPSDSEGEPRPKRRRPQGRSRATPAPETPRKRGRSEGEPGDEGLETGWMQRLSSRLTAYGMSEKSAEERRQGDEPPAPSDGEPTTP
jgi:acyl-coenzyme A synthetase/AMP-(fatty) acid ligase